VGQAFEPAAAIPVGLGALTHRPLPPNRVCRGGPACPPPCPPWSKPPGLPHRQIPWSTQSCVPHRQLPAGGRLGTISPLPPWCTLSLCGWHSCLHPRLVVQTLVVWQALFVGQAFQPAWAPFTHRPLLNPIASVGADPRVRPTAHRGASRQACHTGSRAGGRRL